MFKLPSCMRILSFRTNNCETNSQKSFSATYYLHVPRNFLDTKFLGRGTLVQVNIHNKISILNQTFYIKLLSHFYSLNIEMYFEWKNIVVVFCSISCVKTLFHQFNNLVKRINTSTDMHSTTMLDRIR